MFADRARKLALECADKMEREAQVIGVFRTLDATRASQWLHDLAGAIRKASKADDEPQENDRDG